jgi:hypothetical protein
MTDVLLKSEMQVWPFYCLRHLVAQPLLATMDKANHGKGNRLVIVIVTCAAVGLLAIFPPCRKNDVMLNPVTNKVEEISPWRGYVPIFELPRPEWTRGGNFFIAWDVFAAHVAIIVAIAIVADRFQALSPLSFSTSIHRPAG